mgnify:CR=1 FL=1
MTQTTTPHITQVRQALLDTLGDLRNRESPMDIERAKAVASVASVLVDTAKVENEYLRLTGQDRSAFLEDETSALQRLAVAAPSAHNPFPTSVVHRIED